jgi:hypothetical protein
VFAPLILLIPFACLQIGMYAYGATAAMSAAQNGAAMGAALGGSLQDCQEEAIRAANSFAPALRDPQAVCTWTMTTITVTVTGNPVSLVDMPGIPALITQTAQTPRERWTQK